MGIFKKRNTEARADNPVGLYLGGCGVCDLPPGYHRLIDSPELGAGVNIIASIISSATIYLMENTKKGDVRVKNRLSRFVDVDPWPGMATRQSWMNWIVSYMLTKGDGNAFVLPRSSGGLLTALEPMPGAMAVEQQNGGYVVAWKGRQYSPDEVLHFRLYADLDRPWLGRGIKVQATAVARSLAEAGRLKSSLSSPDYKPPLAVFVDADDDIFNDEKREDFRKKYLEDTDKGKPWILPGALVKLEQIKPLTLSDLAVKDTIELDKKTVASILGIPAFMFGLGSYNADQFNSFIRTTILPIVKGIMQELTLKLLISEDLYWTINEKRLYNYDLEKLINIDLAMSDRGFLTGDEVRETALKDPAGLTEYRVLENYIPYDKSGEQKKLKQTKEGEE